MRTVWWLDVLLTFLQSNNIQLLLTKHTDDVTQKREREKKNWSVELFVIFTLSSLNVFMCFVPWLITIKQKEKINKNTMFFQFFFFCYWKNTVVFVFGKGNVFDSINGCCWWLSLVSVHAERAHLIFLRHQRHTIELMFTWIWWRRRRPQNVMRRCVYIHIFTKRWADGLLLLLLFSAQMDAMLKFDICLYLNRTNR